MRMWKLLIISLIAVTTLIIGNEIKQSRVALSQNISSTANSNFSAAESKYVANLNIALDAVIKKSKQVQATSRHNLIFSSNIFLAHGAYIQYFSTDILVKYADALKSAGAGQVEIYPDPAIWIQGKTDLIAKYDALIAHARKIGLKVAISPEFGTENKFSSFADFKLKVVPALGQIAARYKPDIFDVIHEPTTMETRMKIKGSVNDWVGFVQSAATVVRQNSSDSRIAAGGEWYEIKYLKKFITQPGVDILSLNIYDISKLQVYNQLILLAKQNKKGVYIAETWRSPYQDPNKKAVTLEQGISSGIGLAKYGNLDQKWMEALVVYANVWNLEAVTPFWSTTFFKYETSGDGNAIGYTYNKDAADALMSGKRTATFAKFKSLASEYGRNN